MLTRTQLDALAHLHKTHQQWPTGRGRMRTQYDGVSARYSNRTLAPLALAGLARLVHYDGVMPFYAPTAAVVDGDVGPYVVLPGDWTEPDRRAVARAILTGELWRRYPQAYIDDDRVTRLAHKIVGTDHYYREA